MLDKKKYHIQITKLCDLKPGCFIINTDGKTSGIFQNNRATDNATKDINFTILGQ